jgi:multiple sugar transport system ATP-binding protein
MDIRYEGLAKRFGEVEALRDFDLEVADGQFMVMLGPSGCGKTTALRCLAGLEQPSAGRLLIGGRDVTALPPRHRDVAMVFQSYALYPHMTVAQNIAYPLRLRRVSRQERDALVRGVAETLEIGGLLRRRPRELSGGQRQRVALARAIVRRPAAFLMDEPLSNLDAKLRVQMRVELKRLQKDLGVTTLYVTHDQSEATTMADRVAVMNGGRLEQVGPPREIYNRPVNHFVAGFVGHPPMNILQAEIAAGHLVVGGQELPLSPALRQRLVEAAAGSAVRLGVRAEDVLPAESGRPGLRAEVYVVQPMDNETLVTFRLPDHEQLTARMSADYEAAMGAPATITLREDRLHLFDAGSGVNLACSRDLVGAVEAPPNGGLAKEESWEIPAPVERP